MKTIRHFFRFMLQLFLVVVVMLSSCSSVTNTKKDITSIVPNNTIFVVNVDLGSIWQKGEFDNLKNLDIVKEYRNELKQEDPKVEKLLGEFLNNPLSCGINMKENLVYFATQENDDIIYVFSLLLSSRNDFEKFINSINQISNDASNLYFDYDNENDLYYNTSIDGMLFIYNDDRVMSVWSDKFRYSTTLLKNYSIHLLNLKNNDCITQNSSFKEYWENRGDISMFGMYDKYDLKLPQSFMNLKNMSSYLTCSMEKGSIDVRCNTIGMPENIIGLTNHSFNKNIIKYMPGKTFAAVTLSLNPDKIISLINDIDGNSTTTNEKIGVGNYTTNDLVNAFGGSFVASFYDMLDNEMPAVALAADINNKELIKALIESRGFAKNGDFYSDQQTNMKIYLTNNKIIISTDGALLKTASNGGYNNSLKDIANKAQEGNYAYLYLNLSNYPTEIVNMINKEAYTKYYYDYNTDTYSSYVDEEEAHIFYEIMSWFTFAEAQLDSNGLVVKLHTADNNTNSLSFLINRFDRLIMDIMNK